MNVPAIDNPLDPDNPDPNLFIQQTNPLEEAQARINTIIAEPPPVPEFQLPNEGISSIVAPPPDESDTAVIAPGGGGQPAAPPVDTSEPVVAAVSDGGGQPVAGGSVSSVQKIGGTQTPATPEASGEKTPPLTDVKASSAPPSSDVRQAVLVNKDTLAKYSVNKADLYRMLDFHRQFPAEKDLFVAPTAIEQQDGSGVSGLY